MKKFNFIFLIGLLCVGTDAMANWQYPSSRQRDSWNGDDGMRFVMSVRGGAAYGRANIKNEMGGLTPYYVYDLGNSGEIVTQAYADAVIAAGGDASRFVSAGYGRLGDLPATKNYSNVAFTAGFSAGLTMPGVPQWRAEFGFDHIAEADYNQNPMFEGTMTLIPSGESFEAQSGGIQSTITSDIYSVMAFYDFFDGVKKPTRMAIPYVGVGVGYADTKTVLQLTDSYGDLSSLYELQGFGTVDSSNIIQFNKSQTNSSNLVPMLALGFSYGVSERLFLDAGLRGMFMRKIKWQLTNGESGADAEKRRDWFSAENMVYINATVGLRVEF